MQPPLKSFLWLWAKPKLMYVDGYYAAILQIHTWCSIDTCVSNGNNWVCFLVFRTVPIYSSNNNNSYHYTVHQLINNHNEEEPFHT